MNNDTRRVELAEYFQTLCGDLLDRLLFRVQQVSFEMPRICSFTQFDNDFEASIIPIILPTAEVFSLSPATECQITVIEIWEDGANRFCVVVVVFNFFAQYIRRTNKRIAISSVKAILYLNI